MHRNLRCENILIGADLEPKIADFRVSSMITVVQSLSSTGLDAKAIPWLSPERLRGDAYSWPADTYAFGMICYEMATRVTPFAGVSDMFGLISGICAGQRPNIPDEVPRSLHLLINSCWATSPDQRPTFADIRKHLDAIRF
jgi:serine/threonine protein kinase